MVMAATSLPASAQRRDLPIPVKPIPALKRALDVGLSGLGLIVSAPLWCLIIAAVKLEDGGPVFYGQDRVGEGGRIFRASEASVQ